MSCERIATGGLIDRSRRLSFRFDGTAYEGLKGDTIVSALMANGVRVMGRSFKYHRPRGAWGAWFDDPNAIFDITLNGETLPNCSGAMTPLEEKMDVRSVNAWPTAACDVKGILDHFNRFLPAGFYYKTFMWPNWHLFEPSIRKMAGLGVLDAQVLSDYHASHHHSRCDVLVVGGGAAGLTAARTAAESGQDVIIVDDHPELGGGVYRRHMQIDGQSPADWVESQQTAIIAAGGRVMIATTANGVYDHKLTVLAQYRGFGKAPAFWKVRADRIIMATGAIDRPVTFANNDRPGMLSLEAGVEFLARYGVLPGRSICVLSNRPEAGEIVKPLIDAGAAITEVDPVGVEITGKSGRRLSGLRIGNRTVECDTVLASAGLTPVVHLWRHAGGKLDWDEGRCAFLPGHPPEGMSAIGAANGTYDFEASLREAHAAGLGKTSEGRGGYSLTPLWPKARKGVRQWIDFQNDVTLKDIELAARENLVSVEHLKRYTTLGMAGDQGKTSNMAGLAAMASLRGKPIPDVGTTTFRPPFVPVPLELYAGARRGTRFNAIKRLALESEHRKLDAAMAEYGGWLRPAWYGGIDQNAAVGREIRTARICAAIMDASALGTIEVMGPDASAFLNFIYYNTMSNLKPGRVRYGFMLTEGGRVFDDGVTARLSETHFVVSCSSAHADAVMAHLEQWRQDGNDPDRIYIHDVSDQWSTVTIAGPKATGIVAQLGLSIVTGEEAFPHMSIRSCELAGRTVRVARVSFTGDASYEVSISSLHAEGLWRHALEVGASEGAGPVGAEALSVLRAEKGYVLVGKDTDGETMPHDLGFGAPRLKKTAAFLGDRSLHTDVANSLNRKQLVGLSVASGEAALPIGGHIVVSKGGEFVSRGFVTSSYGDTTSGTPVALGLVGAELAEIGTKVEVRYLGRIHDAEIASASFYDPDGGLLHA